MRFRVPQSTIRNVLQAVPSRSRVASARSSALGELLSCGCFGHWVAFAVTAIYRPRLFVCWWPLDYFLTALVIAGLSAFQWVAMCWLMEKAGKRWAWYTASRSSRRTVALTNPHGGRRSA